MVAPDDTASPGLFPASAVHHRQLNALAFGLSNYAVWSPRSHMNFPKILFPEELRVKTQNVIDSVYCAV